MLCNFILFSQVLMKHLEESHKQMEDENDMDVELEREMEREIDDEEDRALCRALEQVAAPRALSKVPSLPANFTYSEPKHPPTPSPARLARRRRTMHSHHALLPTALQPRRASLSPHAFGRRRQDSVDPPAALYEEDARFIDADDADELDPGSPPRRDSFAHNRRQRADKRNSLRGEEARLLRPTPVLLAVPTARQNVRITVPKRRASESGSVSDAARQPETTEPITEEERIRIVIAERRKMDCARPEPDDDVELAERGS